MAAKSQITQLEHELKNVIDGDLRFDNYSRSLYSTDASIYQMEPIGVVLPKHSEDVCAIVNICSESKTIFLPRGGGTSLAGQAINHGVVIDLQNI